MLQISENIKNARLNKGLTQQEVADKLGNLARTTYANWEKGTEPDLTIIKSLAEILDVSFQELTTGTIELQAKNLEKKPFRQHLLEKKNGNTLKISDDSKANGVPVFDVPIDASFLERYRDEHYYQPRFYINVPKLRNCDFGAVVSGSSMYPIMKSGTIAICRVIEQFDFFEAGEMYYISTKNGFETVKYVQHSDNAEDLLLIPHNEKIKPYPIKKDIIVKMCIVEAWLNFR